MEFLEKLRPMFDHQVVGIELLNLSIALGIIFLTLILKRVVGHILTGILARLTQKTSSSMDDMLLKNIEKPAEFMVVVCGSWIAVEVLQLPVEPNNINGIAHNIVKILFTFNIAWLCYNLVSMVEHWLGHWANKTDSNLDDQLVPFVRKTLRVFIVFIAILMLVQNLGYSISGLLASLGIGGLAVALAAKDTLSNIFGSLMILFDRPFSIGDWVKAGDMEGTVEDIGFRSTRIRTFAKTLITVPNSRLMNMSIDNFSQMPKRRIKLSIGVTYATTAAQMREAVSAIKQLLREHPAIRQDFFLVNFTDFGASSLDIMVYCFTTSTVWGEYLDAREDLSLKIMEKLSEMGLEIAFPSRTLYLHNVNDKESVAEEIEA